MSECFTRRPNIECFICGKSIYRRPYEIERNKGKVYCSRSCYGISCRNENPCVICGTPILASKHKITCSRSCANKNRKGISYRIGRPKCKASRIYGLRLQLFKLKNGICERCGNNNVNILQIHHKIHKKNGGTDDISNLELLCPNCHMTEHKGFRIWEGAGGWLP